MLYFFFYSSNIITAPFKSAGSMASSAGSAVVARIQMVGEKVRQAYTKPSLLSTVTGMASQTASATAVPSVVIGTNENNQHQMTQSLVIGHSSSGGDLHAPGGSLMSHSEHQYVQQVNN